MKTKLKTASALSALLAGLSGSLAIAQEAGGETDRPVQPYYGDINAFYGDINAFYGDINAFYGDINPFWGDINAFYGDINAFYGDIHPFYGDINAFWGDINAFYGDINAFWGDINAFYGDINAFWGDINAFWGDINAFWGDINAFWGDINAFAEPGDYETLASQLGVMFANAETVFGDAIRIKTGQSFDEAFLSGLLAKYGISLEDPQSLAGLSDAERLSFILDFHDGLMAYSGADQVDYWMPTINWTPALAQSVGMGAGVTVGVLDFSVGNSIEVRTAFGQTGTIVNHGSAVTSLIAADMDGEGVMGVAQDVTISTYNPFDETLTTNFGEVGDGVVRLAQTGSSVINMSLGVPGWTLNGDWNQVFSNPLLAPHADDIVFVVAAGNDGSAQNANIDWTGVPVVDNLLIVGSVNPLGYMSSFSNRPGEACFTVAPHA